ncbi:hypothetical protein G1H11_14230 [Phytoactinopolyspora alkaliphila]|uniref:Uncharacterized protein n=1 Tax=Phytoactinopolyspora alkaliphila TaxID=1783498 RepID=A0A6N9YNB2_9ACTN|nr:hypothetical protein [Phytoactinopolyspora alkaliphila]NED96464.1 hypothetical protein [Phytoactinopolyspora alkaliphila]
MDPETPAHEPSERQRQLLRVIKALFDEQDEARSSRQGVNQDQILERLADWTRSEVVVTGTQLADLYLDTKSPPDGLYVLDFTPDGLYWAKRPPWT